MVMLAATLVVLAVGISRVVIGVHYPTDVVAGWLTGAAVAFAVCGAMCSGSRA